MYLIKNRSSGKVIWLNKTDFTTFPNDDGDSALYVCARFLMIFHLSHYVNEPHTQQFAFKDQAYGGTAIRSVRHGTWLAPELRTSTTEHSCRVIPLAESK